MLSFDDALQAVLAAATPVQESRTLPLEACLGRVLAHAQHATVAVPPLDNSAMDGYAGRAEEMTGDVTLPISQRIPAGTIGTPLARGTVARIFTGAPIPVGADAVVMQEMCTATTNTHAEGQTVRIQHQAKLGENIRRAGEDMAPGDEILPAGIRLRAQDIALAAAAGLPSLPVLRRLRVAIFFTGDELHSPGEPLPPGGIYNSNRYALRALLEGLNCEVRDLGIVPDNLEATRAALRQAASDNDVIITSGGVSVGEEDHVKPAVEAEGRLTMWKVAIKPGKPLALGEIVDSRSGKAAKFVGLPGNPVSSFITFVMLVRPFLLRMQGINDVMPRAYYLPSTFAIKKTDPRTEFCRVRINAAGELERFANPSSGVVTSLVWGDGLAIAPANTIIAPGDLLRFIPFTELCA